MDTHKIKRSFEKVKEDLDIIREVQDSISVKVRQKLDSMEREQKNGFSSIQKDVSQKIAEAVDATDESNRKVIDEMALLSEKQNSIDSAILELKEAMAKGQNDIHRRVDVLQSKFQELENMSVDIEDIEKHYVTKEDFDDLPGTKDISNIDKRLDEVQANISKLEEETDSIIPESRVLAIEKRLTEHNANSDKKTNELITRLAKIEKQLSRTEKLELALNQQKEDYSKILELKENFATKQQVSMLKKEIKMLVSGLKDVQKLKKLVAKN